MTTSAQRSPHQAPLAVFAIVFSTAFASPALAQPSVESTALTLRVAIETALDRNLGLQSARREPVFAEAAKAEAEAGFETRLFGGVSLFNDEQDSTGTTSDRRNLSAGANRRLQSGTDLTAETSYSRSDGSFFNNDLNQSVGGQLSHSADLRVTVRQPLWAGRGSRVTLSQLRQAQLGEAATALELRATVLDVLAATERAYWETAAAQQIRDLRQSSVDVAESLLTETVAREELGLVTRIEVLQAQASLAARRDDVLVAQRDLDNAEDRLLEQLGVLVAEVPVERDWALDGLPAANREGVLWDGVWQAALAADPTVAARELRVDQQEEQRLRAKDATRPDLDAVVTAGTTGLDNRESREAYNDAFNADGHFWSVGLEFSMPWSFKAEKARLREAEARVEQAEIAVVERRQALLAEVRSAWRAVKIAQERLSSTGASLALQEATFAQELARRDNGLATTREVLEAQSDLDAARLTDLQARVDLVQAFVSLARLDGSLLDRYALSWDQLALTSNF